MVARILASSLDFSYDRFFEDSRIFWLDDGRALAKRLHLLFQDSDLILEVSGDFRELRCSSPVVPGLLLVAIDLLFSLFIIFLELLLLNFILESFFLWDDVYIFHFKVRLAGPVTIVR